MRKFLSESGVGAALVAVAVVAILGIAGGFPIVFWYGIGGFFLVCLIVVALLGALQYSGPPLIAAPSAEPWYMRHPRFRGNPCDRAELDA